MNAPAAIQRRLPLVVSANVSLVTVETVRAVRGVDAESVVTLLDDGQIQWAWDFSTPGSSTRRELRFWVVEQERGADLPAMPLEEVIAAVIGPTPGGRQRASIIETRWTISGQHIRSLVDAGIWQEDRIGHTRYLRRSNLEAFLQERLIK